MAKLLENTYRHINIALVNEMAKFCHELDIDLHEVIRCASSKPFGFSAFYPGPGVGGHCIPIDPNYLGHRVKAKLGYPFRFVELAQEINNSMPSYVVQRIQEMLNKEGMPVNGTRILLLGVTYKSNISDVRESPAKPLAGQLLARGAVLTYHDPHVRQWSVAGVDIPREDDLAGALSHTDLVVLVQKHSSLDLDLLVSAAPRIFDTRGVLTPSQAERI